MYKKHQYSYVLGKKNIIFFINTILLVFLSSCDSFVEVDQPNSQLTAGAVFESRTTANAAMVDIYSQFREAGLFSGKTIGLSVLAGCYSDEFVAYQNGSYSAESFYKNTLLASSPVLSGLWNASYNQIYSCNAVIDGVNNSLTLMEADKKQLEGEGLFLRSLIHFYLLNLFGNIPFITTTDYTQNRIVSRMGSDEIFLHLINDLEKSVTLLPENYITTNRFRPNRATAQALLAKVYLYHGQYAEAANSASAVINREGTYVWQDDLDKIFLKESTTTIWQFAPASEGANTYDGQSLIFPQGPPTLVSLRDDFVAQFEEADLRKSHWIGAVSDGTNTWFHPYKYKQKYASGSTTECTIVMRLAEQHLIRAEARAQQSDIIGAREDINKIRNRAGLLDTDAFTRSELLKAVLAERRLEFFSEHGQRFFDLKRFGQLDTALSVKPGWNSTDSFWPLPQSELLVNPYLFPQNPGY